MANKISLEFTQDEIDVIFACLIGSYSCPSSFYDLVNYVHGYANFSDFYCDSYEKEKKNKDELP